MVAQTYNDDEAKRIIGENVRKLRAASGRSVIDLTESIRMARGYWYEIERGEVNVTIEVLQQIADLFDVTVRDLLTEPRKRKEPAGARR